MDGKANTGLMREQMPAQARLAGNADIFDALTAFDRPYKSDIPLSQVLATVCRMHDNWHIDPDLFEVVVCVGGYLRYARVVLEQVQIDEPDPLVSERAVPERH